MNGLCAETVPLLYKEFRDCESCLTLLPRICEVTVSNLNPDAEYTDILLVIIYSPSRECRNTIN
jgi:hypothetical protein